MTEYAPLLNRVEQEGGVRVYLTPEDAIKLVARLRKVAFFIRIDVPLITGLEEGGFRAYDGHENLRVSAAQLTELLEKKRCENERRIERKGPEHAGRVEVSRHGDCIFVG